MTNDLLPTIGHNQPPLIEALAADHADLLKRRDDLAEAFKRAPEVIEDEATNKRSADFVKQLQTLVKSAESKRIDGKEPYLKAGREVDAFFKGVTDPIAAIKIQIERRMTVWQRKVAEAERQRREAEAETARQAAAAAQMEADLAAEGAKTDADVAEAISAETAARQAAADAIVAAKAVEAKPADMARTRGDYGSVASLKTWLDFENLVRGDLDLETLRPYLPSDGLEKAVRAWIRANSDELKKKINAAPESATRQGSLLRGVKVFVNSGTQVR